MLNVPDVQASDLPFLSCSLLILLIWYQCFTQYVSILSQSKNYLKTFHARHSTWRHVNTVIAGTDRDAFQNYERFNV